ncbi:unnamed protein product [Adineta ricciae]|uniref:Uncharacterized protein n=1 Tax=Adineta ricciae TaxID=249248 RepID=A0A815SWG5_ADIRI|nr:unnamed protein product [Adineta ricciae]
MYAVSNGYSSSYYGYTPAYPPFFYGNMYMQNSSLYPDADGARRNFSGNNRVARRQISGPLRNNRRPIGNARSMKPQRRENNLGIQVARHAIPLIFRGARAGLRLLQQGNFQGPGNGFSPLGAIAGGLGGLGGGMGGVPPSIGGIGTGLGNIGAGLGDIGAGLGDIGAGIGDIDFNFGDFDMGF